MSEKQYRTVWVDEAREYNPLASRCMKGTASFTGIVAGREFGTLVGANRVLAHASLSCDKRIRRLFSLQQRDKRLSRHHRRPLHPTETYQRAGQHCYGQNAEGTPPRPELVTIDGRASGDAHCRA